MGAADAHQHTDSNRNHNGSHELHGIKKVKKMGLPKFGGLIYGHTVPVTL